MKRNTSSRGPSPTNTTYSGISNYRTDSYKPIGDRNRTPSMPVLDSKTIARAHYEEMADYLENYLAKEPANARSSAREKLTKLTRQQFQELSTDVYDELIRRRNNTEREEVPFLPVRDDFHPKRNQARQKLATLPISRFKDLSSDVFHELGRRYPEFKEPEVQTPFDLTSPGSTYDDTDVPSPDYPASPPYNPIPVRSPPVARPPLPTENIYAGGHGPRRPSQDTHRRRPSEDVQSRNVDSPYGYGQRGNNGDLYGHARKTSDEGFGHRRRPSDESTVQEKFTSPPSRRKPSVDVVNNLKNEERRRLSPDLPTHGRRPSADINRDRDRDEASRKLGGASFTLSDPPSSVTNAQREVIVPNKSMMAEEEIEVPYGRERESFNTNMDDRRSRSPDLRSNSPYRRPDIEMEDSLDNDPRSMSTQMGGLNGLGARLRGRMMDEDTGRAADDYHERASVASDRSSSTGHTGRLNGTRAKKMTSSAEETEELRRKYEFQVATMQSRVTGLERDLEEANATEAQRRMREKAGDEKVKALENEMRLMRERAEEQGTAMRSLERDIEEMREERAREKELEQRRAQNDACEIQRYKKLYEQLEAEQARGSGENNESVEQLRSDMDELLSELSDLSQRYDEAVAARESDVAKMRSLESQVKDYKRKYEAAKTDLRSMKATSQLFLQAPQIMDSDLLPVSSEGGVPDIHITAFLSSIDGLLTAGRSNAPTRILTPMQGVVDAVSAIIQDLRDYTRDHGDESDYHHFQELRERAEATLSNLVTASRTHATSLGMSPVSLLDAAASHLCSTVTDIGRALLIRRASADEREAYLSASPADAGYRFQNSLDPVSESPAVRQRQQPAKNNRSTPGTSSRSGHRNNDSLPSNPTPESMYQSGSDSGMDHRISREGPDDAWAELKPYLEAQSESITYAIQSVLSNVRNPNSTSTLNENLAQIITIVASIVAVCKDSLPTRATKRGRALLEDLSQHADKLSEIQNLPEATKESRQQMAKSSFAIANALKEIIKL